MAVKVFWSQLVVQLWGIASTGIEVVFLVSPEACMNA